MPDRISSYRQIRLLLSPHGTMPRTSVTLQAVSVRKGVPTASAIDHFVLDNSPMPETTEDLVDALIEALEALKLRWHLPEE